MDAVDFLVKLSEFCKVHRCGDCPLFIYPCPRLSYAYSEPQLLTAATIVKIVEKWDATAIVKIVEKWDSD